jgi:hypothetical protein
VRIEDVDESGVEIGAVGASPTCLTCLSCGRIVPYSDAELLDYINDGLPRCCGEAMTIAPRQSPGGQEAPRPAD